MVLTSILVYGSLTAIMFFLGKFADERQSKRKRLGLNTPFFVPEIILTLLAFVLVCGARWDVGSDYLTYLKDYLYLQDTGHIFSRDNIEFGFEFISRIFAIFHIHFFFYFAFLAFLQLFFVLYAFKNERYLYPYFAIIIVLGSLFFTWNNGIRQAIASCIFLYSYKFIEKRQFLKYLIIISLASLIHHSALLCIILYFILNRDIPYNKYWYIVIMASGIILGKTEFWTNFANNIDKLLSTIGYEQYVGTNTISLIDSKSLGGRSLIIVTLCAINIWYFPKIHEYFNYEKRIKVFFVMYFLGVTGFFMLVNTYILARITYYFLIFQIPSLSYLLLYAKNNKKIIYYGLIAMFVLYSLASYILDSGLTEDWTNYKFFWNYII